MQARFVCAGLKCLRRHCRCERAYVNRFHGASDARAFSSRKTDFKKTARASCEIDAQGIENIEAGNVDSILIKKNSNKVHECSLTGVQPKQETTLLTEEAVTKGQNEYSKTTIETPGTDIVLDNQTSAVSSQSIETASHRFNVVGIQMLSPSLHEQIFNNKCDATCSSSIPESAAKATVIKQHLKRHDLADKRADILPDVELSLPALKGRSIDEHFRSIANEQLAQYVPYMERLAAIATLPMLPAKWRFEAGWTKYDAVSRKSYPVECPEEEAIVFDVEVLMAEGCYPTMATAASETAWYSWCSKRLFEDKNSSPGTSSQFRFQDLTPADLCPLESSSAFNSGHKQRQPHIVIGHNVGFDRSFVRDQYNIKRSRQRFFDTMSMHIAISGLTSLQRVLFVARKAGGGSRRKEVLEHEEEMRKHSVFSTFDWTKETSLNNLNDVYQLYCKTAPPLQKHLREVFISGEMMDVRDNFQDLMTYCADDVKATQAIFRKMWPEFLQRFPHPVTLAGMLEMGTAYLPVNNNWSTYIKRAQAKYEELQADLTKILCGFADEALKLAKDGRYKDDVWLWDLDWVDKKILAKKSASKTNAEVVTVRNETSISDFSTENVEPIAKSTARAKSSTVRNSSKLVAASPSGVSKYLIYPRWYAELCPRETLGDGVVGRAILRPTKLSLQRRVTPKLLRLMWNGFPLHYDSIKGWGYLVPSLHRSEEELELLRQEAELNGNTATNDSTRIAPPSTDGIFFPYESLVKVCQQTRRDWVDQVPAVRLPASEKLLDELLQKIQNSTGTGEDQAELWRQLNDLQESVAKDVPDNQKVSEHSGEGPYLDVIDGCEFYKLPHKDGASKRVGNPLAKDFASKIEQGVLQSFQAGTETETVLTYGGLCSYWKNNVARISSQMVVQLSTEPRGRNGFYGAIVPRIVTAGTVTRRAVEATWLTASNAYKDRIGSELKSMIQSPPGYHFVGADVDSQELWIAALLGDAYFQGEHGCTAFGWMTLQGNKSDGTDLHSKTAKLVGISREHAKVFNYGRIYGAGQKFAELMLLRFNSRLTKQETKVKARAMFRATKGRRLKAKAGDDSIASSVWEGGSESHMFNMLEKISRSDEPRTPVLNCCISKSLEPRNVSNEFMTSRINWVVQSSAVDYLHLMLVSMRWLFETYNIDGRFCISIHDEVRYLVNSDDRYRAALALQITNLLTRSMFAYKLGMNDLPQSIAFFSSVDVDTCLRKEVNMDSVTPSNPDGLEKGYSIPPGESLDIHNIKERTKGELCRPDIYIDKRTV